MVMDHIERLERQIEELYDAVQRSRRLMLIGKTGVLGGVVLLTWWTVHTSVLSLTWFLAGVALSLGGLVLAGSSRSTADEQEIALREAEDDRNRAIDALHLRSNGKHEFD
jgi:hypothetical protein